MRTAGTEFVLRTYRSGVRQGCHIALFLFYFVFEMVVEIASPVDSLLDAVSSHAPQRGRFHKSTKFSVVCGISILSREKLRFLTGCISRVACTAIDAKKIQNHRCFGSFIWM